MHYFTYEGTTTHYTKTGTGNNVLLAFHGFGQDHRIFKDLAQHLGSHYTLYSFDLFFHGKSEWNKGEVPLDKKFWSGWLKNFRQHHQIDRFSMVGFSLGAKFVMASIEICPTKINEVILIAPDGIKLNGWYWLATYPLLTRKIFKKLIQKPQIFTALTDVARITRLIDKRTAQFALSQMNSEEKRARVYYTWVILRYLTFNLKQVAKTLNENNVKCQIVMGKKDTIIPPTHTDSFVSMINNPQFLLLDAYHHNLVSTWINTLSQTAKG